MFLNPAYFHLSGKAHRSIPISICIPNDKMYTIKRQVLFIPLPLWPISKMWYLSTLYIRSLL